MKVKRSSSWWASAVVMMLMAGPAAAQLKIGVINSQKLLAGSPQAQAMSARLETEYGTRQKEIVALQTSLKSMSDKLQKDGATMTADQRTRAQKDFTEANRDYEQKLSNFNEDVSRSQEQEMQRVQVELSQAIDRFAKEHKYDLLLTEAAFANSTLDVTDALLATLKTGAPAAAARPATPAPAAK